MVVRFTWLSYKFYMYWLSGLNGCFFKCVCWLLMLGCCFTGSLLYGASPLCLTGPCLSERVLLVLWARFPVSYVGLTERQHLSGEFTCQSISPASCAVKACGGLGKKLTFCWCVVYMCYITVVSSFVTSSQSPYSSTVLVMASFSLFVKLKLLLGAPVERWDRVLTNFGSLVLINLPSHPIFALPLWQETNIV